ncbi:MAG: hypothetical protein ACI8XB_000128 [Patiriisocius sp.]|jgi:hypothetical protein
MNSRKKTIKKKRERKSSRFSKAFIGILNGTFLGRDNLLNQLPFVFFLVAVAISYISYGYYAESTLKTMSVVEAQVKDLKSQNLTLQSKLELQKQQSSVATSIASLELSESVVPPYKIEMNEVNEEKGD